MCIHRQLGLCPILTLQVGIGQLASSGEELPAITKGQGGRVELKIPAEHIWMRYNLWKGEQEKVDIR